MKNKLATPILFLQVLWEGRSGTLLLAVALVITIVFWIVQFFRLIDHIWGI